MIDQTLPTLQDAVDALHARLTAGRVRSTGTAANSGLTGRTADLSPDDLIILEASFGSEKKGARLLETWGRDDLHAAGASEADWDLETELSYQLISRGDTLSDLIALDDEARTAMLGVIATTVERIMRAGPYRSKWDDPRGAVTWLAQDCANAVQTTYDRLKKYRDDHPDFSLEWDDEQDQIPPDETPEQIITRLERELAAERRAHAQTRTVNAVQMTIIRNHNQVERKLRERVAALEEYVTGIDNLLARRDLSGTDKVMTLVATRDLHTRTAKGVYTIARGRLADLAGVSVSTVTNSLKKICTPKPEKGKPYLPDDRPFAKVVTHEDVVDQDTGEAKTISVIQMRPWKATARETLQAAATFAVPEDRPKHGGSAAAVEAREQARRGCEHDDADVIVNGICAAGGEDLGDRRLTAEQWAALKDQVDLSVGDPSPVYVQVSMGDQLDLSAPSEEIDARAAAMVATRIRDVDKWRQPQRSDQEPVSAGRIRFTRSQKPPDDQESPPAKPTVPLSDRPYWSKARRQEDLPAAAGGAEE